MENTSQNRRSLQKICEEHNGKVSDKWESYLDLYDNLFDTRRESLQTFLEIGIQNGGSLEIFAQYFPKATKLLGIDINPKCKTLIFKDQRIKVLVGDANSTKILSSVLEEKTLFDVIIDDGSHTTKDIIQTFCLYFPLLNENGIFVIEDLHASYWYSHEGALNYPLSSIEFLKKLIDVVNYYHWGAHIKATKIFNNFIEKYNLDLPPEILLSIGSVYFQDSVCVITKANQKASPLGLRKIHGQEASIDKEVLGFNNVIAERLDQANNPLFIPHDQGSQILSLEESLNQALSLSDQLEKQLINQRDALALLKNSASWRYTAQFRWLKGKLLQLRRGF